MKTKNIIQILCILILLGGLLVGCGKGAGSESANLPKYQEATLTIMMPRNNDTLTGDAYIKAKTLFEAGHPGVTVNIVEDTTFDLYENRILGLNEAGGVMPDVIQVFTSMAPDFAEAEVLADLNLFIDIEGISDESFFPNINEMTSIDGKLLWLGTTVIPREMIYSKKWFDKANLPYPKDGWTWDEVTATAKKLYEANGNGSRDKYGILIPAMLTYLETIMMTNGGSILSPDGSKASGYLDGEASVEAMKWLHHLYHVEKLSPVMTYGYSTSVHMIDVFAGMVLSSHDAISRYFVENPDMIEHIGVVGMPTFKEGVRSNSLGLSGFGVTTKSANPELAWEFLKFIALEKNEASMDLLSIGMNSSRILAEDAKGDPLQQVKFNEITYAKRNADQSNRKWISIAFIENAYASQLEGTIGLEYVDIQEELTRIAKSIDANLAN